MQSCQVTGPSGSGADAGDVLAICLEMQDATPQQLQSQCMAYGTGAMGALLNVPCPHAGALGGCKISLGGATGTVWYPKAPAGAPTTSACFARSLARRLWSHSPPRGVGGHLGRLDPMVVGGTERHSSGGDLRISDSRARRCYSPRRDQRACQHRSRRRVLLGELQCVGSTSSPVSGSRISGSPRPWCAPKSNTCSSEPANASND